MTGVCRANLLSAGTVYSTVWTLLSAPRQLLDSASQEVYCTTPYTQYCTGARAACMRGAYKPHHHIHTVQLTAHSLQPAACSLHDASLPKAGLRTARKGRSDTA